MGFVEKTDIYIGGTWAPATGGSFDITSPVTELVEGRVPAGSAADVDRAVTSARAAFDSGPWPWMTAADRAAALRRVASALRRRGGDVARFLRLELGAPVAFGERMKEAPAAALDFFAGVAEQHGHPQRRTRLDGGTSVIVREPVGVVAGIVPWNGPPQSAAKKVGAALAAGCTVVLKGAPEGSLSLYPLMEAADEAGLPPGVLNFLPGDAEVSSKLVAHDGIDCVSFTGSESVGAKIAAVCASRHKRVILELGGKSAAIVTDDVDMRALAPSLASIVTMMSGQACLLFSRLLISRKRHDEFVEVMTAALSQIIVGDPDDPRTQMGPVANRQHRERIEAYVALGQKEGATVAYGGGRPATLSRGFYVEPTLLTGVHNGMRIAREEVFGPVICVLPFDDLDDAISIANDSAYGLSGGIFTADERLGFDVARRIRSGTFNINGCGADVGVPFGGVKSSGIGREGGAEGFECFTETKTINLPAGSNFELESEWG